MQTLFDKVLHPRGASPFESMSRPNKKCYSSGVINSCWYIHNDILCNLWEIGSAIPLKFFFFLNM